MKKKNRFLIALALSFALPVTIMMVTLFSVTGCKTIQSDPPQGPCDIYTAAGYPCVTAHSTTRALYASYNGPLYQIMRQSDGQTLDIGVVRPANGDPGGYADAAAHDAFCSDDLCWITKIYDQSGNGNHLVQAPPGTFRGPAKGGFNTLPVADIAPITIMGHKVYGVYIIPGMGLRNNNASGLAINDEPQGIYMVCDGKHYDSGCCFNYGNTSTNSRAVGRGTMETVYFGTATAWGSGSGTGPWIMSDMEAGLFSGYDAKQNAANPTIDSWRFVTGMVNGGGGNKWEIWGGNAQEGDLTSFYQGIRPHSQENDWYYPMHRKGAVQLGNGGDNGNGSAGTFYEGVMTTGYPDEATLRAVQANIHSAGYDVQLLDVSRITTFTPGSAQDVTVTFTNTTGQTAKDVTLGISLPTGWDAFFSGSPGTSTTIKNSVKPGENVNATFTVISPSITGAGFIYGTATWKNKKTGSVQSEKISSRVRNVSPVKINEVRLTTGRNPTNQFIELYNAGDSEVDLSEWKLINTRIEWAPVLLGTIPAETKLQPDSYYLLGLSSSGLAAPANSGDRVINVISTTGFNTGQQIDIGGEKCTITNIGTPASPMAAVFVPVPTGPWITIPAGSTNLPVTDASGFKVGQKIGIDMGGNYEVATVTSVGKAGTLTNLAVEAKAGDTVIKVQANSDITVGDTLTIGTGSRMELAIVKRIINVVEAPVRGSFGQGAKPGHGEIELTTPLIFDHMLDVDVTTPGTGISFTPATRFTHKSGDAVQALGSGIRLGKALAGNHDAGTYVLNTFITSAGYQGPVKPDQWYGTPLSSTGGSVALYDNSGALADALVYGSEQTNSGANGTVTSPEIAFLEGDQKQGGCIVVVPGPERSYGPIVSTGNYTNTSAGRFPDGADNDDNCRDFMFQNTTSLAAASAAGINNIKVTSVTNFNAGQTIIIGTDTNSETVIIEEVGTPGATALNAATNSGSVTLPVVSSANFSAGQTITIDKGSESETAVIASIFAARRRFGVPGTPPADSITLSLPLKNNYPAGAMVAGSGITLTSSLTKTHVNGEQVAGNIPTPGKPNKYIR